MTNDVIGHIENIKVFTDYKKSGFDTYEMFLEEVENGRIPFFKDLNTLSILKDAPEDEIGFEKFFEKNSELILETQEEKREQIKRLGGYSNIYFDAIRAKVEGFAERNPNFFINQPLKYIFSEVISVYPSLESYLDTTKEIFREYVELAKNLKTNIVFDNLVELQRNVGNRNREMISIKKELVVINDYRSSENYLIKNRHEEQKKESNVLRDETLVKTQTSDFPVRIFKSKEAFELFKSWCEEKNSNSDLSYIYGIMKEDGLIYSEIGRDEYKRFLSEKKIIDDDFQMKSLQTISIRGRKSQYEMLKQQYSV